MSNISCPLPHEVSDVITLAHAAGGSLMHNLIHRLVTPIYGKGFAPDHDGAVFSVTGKLAFTTDSYVVKPLFFPGGDIGKLAVYGTVNDLAMCGANPMYLSCSFILEEGLPFETLRRVCSSISAAASETNTSIVTGDTKVVGRGQADGIYINTSGVGIVPEEVNIHPHQIKSGDSLILSGDIGRHGIAVLSAREELTPEGDLLSDCAPLAAPIQALLNAGLRPKCLRDLTRGGLAAALLEISNTVKLGIEIETAKIPYIAAYAVFVKFLGLIQYTLPMKDDFWPLYLKKIQSERLAYCDQ